MEPVLVVDNLRVEFPYRKQWLPAVRGVSFQLMPGETLALVGESGSGKSVTSQAIMGLIDPPARVMADDLRFENQSLLTLKEEEKRKLRGRRMSMIFQDPMTALNPLMRVGQQVCEAILWHTGRDAASAKMEALSWLSKVGLNEPDRVYQSYPHELSGGMRQRVVIAIALCLRPSLVIADEPTTALDVTVQAQILQLLQNLQREVGMAVLLVTHDLGVVQEVADRVAVCYAGNIVESASAYDLFSNPKHPYTQGLLDSIPRLDRPLGPLPSIPGVPPSLQEVSDGCSFAPRCSQCFERCQQDPPEVAVGDGSVRCWRVEATKERPLETSSC